MRLVRQTRLYFREGNSDKTYEIDLCELSQDQYVVNFRYGKRGGSLKEGSKTVSPVALAEATVVFDALEKEKRSKGYTEEAIAVPVTPLVPVDTSTLDNPKHRAVIRRLEEAAGGSALFKTAWSVSRVIWKAGEFKIPAAVPYILRLIEKGGAIQRYASIWALGRCGGTAAATVLKAYADNGSYPAYVRQLAANALLLVLPPDQQAQHIQQFLLALPPAIQTALQNRDYEQLQQALDERVRVHAQPSYPLLEDLYIVAATDPLAKQALLQVVGDLPLRPSYFRHIRHLFKQAELRDDHELVALLARRFEREPEMFRKPSYESESWQPQLFLPELQEYVTPSKELKKPTSKVAYSNRTRQYLHRRVLRHLRQLGEEKDLQYVRLATALLLQYDDTAAEAPYHTSRWIYRDGRYNTIETRYPANAHAVFLHYILNGLATAIQLVNNGLVWRMRDTDVNPPATEPSSDHSATPEPEGGGILKKLFGWLGGEKKQAGEQIPGEDVPADPPPETDSVVPYLPLWQQLPQAFIQLLIKGRMEDIHRFALEQLEIHPDYTELRSKMDLSVISGLLASSFPIPQTYGLALAMEKYADSIPDAALILAMVYSPMEAARQQGLQWLQEKGTGCYQEPGFIFRMVFCPYADVHAFITTRLAAGISAAEQESLVSHTVDYLLSLRRADQTENELITRSCGLLEAHAGTALNSIALPVIESLLQSTVPACQAFAARLLLLKQQDLDVNTIPDTLLRHLLLNYYAPVREAGIAVISAMNDHTLAQRAALLLTCCTIAFADIRRLIQPVVARVAQHHPETAVWLVNELVPLLMRKETSAGLHEDVAALLSGPLAGHLQDIDKAAALRLVYSNYASAQAFGVLVLEKYIPPASLSLKQVIATGNHELLAVREWCWRFFEAHTARIRYERDEAIALMDATWEDTRQFAINYFRTQFHENDWTPETLVAIADSVRPEIQAFGRELLTRFFRQEDGIEYLLKLSQHPDTNMQLFATNYLEHYAAGNLTYLRQLDHYFRSVLSRVNKARTAKERIFSFLDKEAAKSPEAATFIADIIIHISATVSVGDKARCLVIMRNIHRNFNIPLPVQFVAVTEKNNH